MAYASKPNQKNVLENLRIIDDEKQLLTYVEIITAIKFALTSYLITQEEAVEDFKAFWSNPNLTQDIISTLQSLSSCFQDKMIESFQSADWTINHYRGFHCSYTFWELKDFGLIQWFPTGTGMKVR